MCLPARSTALFCSTLLFASLGSLGFAPDAHAATRSVTNCNDSGAGSLRTAVVGAANNDVVDMRGLSCGTIFLNGAIPIRVANLQIVGPGYSRLTVNGRERGRVLQQEIPTPPNTLPRVDGDLILRGFSVSWGRTSGQYALGGCLFAQSRLHLQSMQVHHCTARSSGTPPEYGSGGGGAWGYNAINATNSFVHSNRAFPNGAGGGLYSNWDGMRLDGSRIAYNTVDTNGGGVIALFGFWMYRSTIDHNTATDGPAGGIATAGGAVLINKSTVSWNHAQIRGVGEFDGGYPQRVVESTLSHNSADFDEGGIALLSFGLPTEILNSTIAFNVALAESFEGACRLRGSGLSMNGIIRVNSSIISGNTCAGKPADVGRTQEIDIENRVVGADNLIGKSFIAIPSDTILTNSPRLAPLANNGGPTQTHALLSDSPAVDAGNNLPVFLYDQRGQGFPRVVNGRADIGAFER
ncbi:hypothetical protein LF41_1137 [Lysobacter dokdonensis DS-58]|uniref:Right handed beta helix domain-containing protein n=1 Tax=Lysobacter dokdonensis DS-58 TaxID=1300345 RepID=A0A0A2WQP3_9GAMM|nr:choice-of-anchor Q domain-containing protein [Lysobacter dokdonensis]KGQ20600.1 hypothetical protein LF41_1137 [Lysobacter dokdonensis DS-58]